MPHVYMVDVTSILISVAVSIVSILGYIAYTAVPPPPPVMPTDVPIGTIVPYAGADIPAGWIACDNKSYTTTTYPKLYDAIGYTYGMDGKNYRVPDTRGVFMRGMDANATRDTNRPAGSIQLSAALPDVNGLFGVDNVGYVPPPKADQKNSYLRGDGTWQLNTGVTVQDNATGNRGFGSVYRNTTGKTMFVSVANHLIGGHNHLYAYSDSNNPPNTPVSLGFGDSNGEGVFFLVLNNNYYRVNPDSGGAMHHWIEWY